MSDETDKADIRRATARECEKIANEVCSEHCQKADGGQDSTQHIAAAMAASEIARRIAALYR